MIPNWLKRAVETVVEPIRTRANNNDLNALLGVPDAATKSIYGNLGDFIAQTNLKSLLAVIGSGWNTANKDLYTLLITDLLSNGTHGLAALKALIDAVEAKLDDGTTGLAALKALIDAVEVKLDAISGPTGIFYEQADVAVNITAIAASETNVFDLSTANTRYIVRHLRLKFADPSTETVTVRLYELINDVLTVVDTFIVDNSNYGTYFSLMDMFGVPHLAGDNLKVTVQASGGAGVAVTGQYSHAKTNV